MESHQSSIRNQRWLSQPAIDFPVIVRGIAMVIAKGLVKVVVQVVAKVIVRMVVGIRCGTETSIIRIIGLKNGKAC